MVDTALEEINQMTLNNIFDLNTLLIEASQKFNNEVLIESINDEDGSFKYGDLANFLNGLNAFFAEKCVEKKSSVAVMLPNDITMALLFLCVPALDRVFVPINPKLSLDEVAYICQDSDVKFIITIDALKTLIPSDIQSHTIQLGTSWIEQIMTYTGNDIQHNINKNTIAEIVYTSGTTGKPKGVELSHLNLISNSYGISQTFEFSSKDRFLTITPLFHNSGQLFTTLAPMWTGSCSIPIRPELSLGIFWQLVSSKKITWTLGMGSHINYLLSIIDSLKSKPKHDLKGILTGGMKLDPIKRKQFEEFYQAQILITYGLTETTSFATSDKPGDEICPGSVGKPLKTNEIRIDKNNGDEGEILIKGDNIFECYHNLPELTSTKKVDGWLRTGDLGFMNEKGFLFISDRIDNLIIVSGENVYPAEIEQFSYLFPELYEFIIVGKNHDIKGQEIAMIYTLKEGKQANLSDWSKKFLDNLANYKVPTNYINITDFGLKELPKAPNGKILRGQINKLMKELD